MEASPELGVMLFNFDPHIADLFQLLIKKKKINSWEYCC